jgi:hypothetical protein
MVNGKVSNTLSIKAKLLNGDSIQKALVEAFEQWAAVDINQDHWREQFLERGWPYSGKTKRKNPSAPIREAESPRDIYDFGRLYESGVQSFELQMDAGTLRASWHWDAKNASGKEYAWYVHYGKGTNTTARPFTDDISIPASFFYKAPGMALLRRITVGIEAL